MTGIYLHIPFCVRKCHYCDFYSEEIIPHKKNTISQLQQFNPNNIDTFVDYLCKEIEFRHSSISERLSISTIFFGGGTPSLLTSLQIDRILNLLTKYFVFDDNPEITLECNPGTTSKEKLMNYAGSGVNRLSFGAQSFVKEELDFLQRIHSPVQIERAFDSARSAGFTNINFDMMFSVPGQTEASLMYSLNKAIDLAPEHISAYSLIYEPDTPLYEDYRNGRVTKISDDNDALFYDITKNTLIDAGFVQYEVSNFAKSEQLFCRHNLIYWGGKEYISFGPSAHGYYNNQRYWNYRSNTKYFECIDSGKLPVEGSEIITTNQKLTEHIFLGLRATGVDLTKIRNEFNYDFLSENKELIDELIKSDHINIYQDKLSLTKKGYSMCDEITLKFIDKIVQ